MKTLPVLEEGWAYLYKVKYHTWVELSDGRAVYVGPTDGMRIYCHNNNDGWFHRDALEAVKLLPEKTNNKEEKKNGTLPKLQRNTKRS